MPNLVGWSGSPTSRNESKVALCHSIRPIVDRRMVTGLKKWDPLKSIKDCVLKSDMYTTVIMLLLLRSIIWRDQLAKELFILLTLARSRIVSMINS